MNVRTGSILAAVGVSVLALFVATPPAGAADDCHLPRFGPGEDYHPPIDPANFGPDVTNPLFPLTPGTTLVYSGSDGRSQAMDIFATTSRTIVLDGVTAHVVEDRLYLDGILAERTSDYYAQDKCGNVWYFGEDTAELDEDGNVISTEGTWHAGVDGAQPGVYMQADPEVGRKFRQEWLQGEAEDVFDVVSLDERVRVPAGSFRHAMLTEETSDLEPGVLDHKYYVRGIGQVKEVSITGGFEEFNLVEVIK